ncbi:MAG: methionyl-tRNA formyltransferase [Verrucomicrobia bacterium]|nr:methionyl-tRNA formyltransferase [Verrucomicrobiota bacterium]
MKVIFFGTSGFAARVLTFLVENKIDVRAIVTRIDKPKGRNLEISYPPVKQTALQICPQVPVLQPQKASTPEFEQVLKAYDADLFVVVAYGEIIKQNILDIPKMGCINIHASLLPTYRGAAPMQRCLMDGAKETGITIIEMTLQMDAGDILAIKSIPVPPNMTLGELEPQLCSLGCELVLEVIQEKSAGVSQRQVQDHTAATLAPKITAEEEVISWTKSAQDLHNQVRALSPFPGAWCKVLLGNQEKRLKIKRSLVEPGFHDKPGTLLQFSKEGCVVAAGAGALRLLEVQLEGKKTMSIADFVKGVRQPPQFL